MATFQFREEKSVFGKCQLPDRFVYFTSISSIPKSWVSRILMGHVLPTRMNSAYTMFQRVSGGLETVLPPGLGIHKKHLSS